ncbi:microsomal signal peptidase 25 kDa subunit-domain-containing protein [Syncephalis fuscata]|nr:microsomal signal peptidase 25 kDa subunit-domain-containing protein [Syncephalis fuscata]
MPRERKSAKSPSNEKESSDGEVVAVNKPKPDVIVNKLSLSELRYASDDAVKEYLNEKRKYQQVHRHTDIKLLLGYAACAVALGDFLYGWKKPFEQFRTVSAISVSVYVILSLAAALYTYFVEDKNIYIGKRGHETIRMDVEVKDAKPIYHVNVVRELTDGNEVDRRERTLAKPFTDWFDVNGLLVRERLELDIASLLD